ncbi:hypothetical protein P3553_06515 [Vibrio parahaemolyticus]|uniref:hypothetical protein n=1 Tax=Vibrio parahaemolyticus TaxID=670 RepID=UPI00038E2760|nr:hypothetical protein [Vibrio parahaemolyticus]PIS69248.1 hypothetical protein H271_17130 [Vibrio parahaemolyticus 1911C]EHR0801441.1 hypothetical protein [Vibrio parahaemolyticus]EHR0803588.1 hypothetical protein [Vibrio parahaemolyticus]EHR6401241.1 hypothetical protein [Vibrio parahaemolyticus]EHR6403640.1 hypothetical protein [Vibrio parahaemolyticus]
MKPMKALDEIVTNVPPKYLMSNVVLISIMINELVVNKLVVYRAGQYFQLEGV